MSAIVKLATQEQLKTDLNLAKEIVRDWEKSGLLRGHLVDGKRTYSVQEVLEVDALLKGAGPAEVPRLKAPMCNPEVRCIELFAGCGGLALGLHNAGITAELLVEIDPKASDTLKRNSQDLNLGWTVLHQDVNTVDFTPYRGKITVVTGGFPCQAFSYAGQGKGFGDPRGTLFFQQLRCIKETDPLVVVGENVRGLEEHDDGKTLKTMLHYLDEAGYEVEYRVMHCQYLDVPQKRPRLLILGVKRGSGLKIQFPEQTGKVVPVSAALNGVPAGVGYTYSDWKYRVMDQVPPGGNWRDLPLNVQKSYMGKSFTSGGGKTGMARRLSWHEPSLTLTCNPAQKQTERCHPSETRPLNVREYARIQTFPDEWQFSGSISSQYKQIGNAVPVNFGYHIGMAVRKILGV